MTRRFIIRQDGTRKPLPPQPAPSPDWATIRERRKQQRKQQCQSST
jgi:hypothetical protein